MSQWYNVPVEVSRKDTSISRYVLISWSAFHQSFHRSWFLFNSSEMLCTVIMKRYASSSQDEIESDGLLNR